MINNKLISEHALKYGFGLVGFSPVTLLTKETSRLKEWLEEGNHAGMGYMERNLEKKENVKEILASAESVISLGMFYNSGEVHEKQNEEKQEFGKVSRYAWGTDYHFIMWERLEEMIDELKEIDSGFEAVFYVDTGPVMDKVWAVKSGLGWQGKNTNVINKDSGSFFFIANIINNKKFDYSIPLPDFCGTCSACIDACPTDALKPYHIDARKCISYLTIENKGEIPKEFKGKFENWIFGCDICQDVCPWNKKFSLITSELKFHSSGNKELEIEKILNMEKEEFKKRFEVSPIKRSKLLGLKRNAEYLKS
ncbi:MAG: tRNA epoxyqueuosine(34) reductase QueG [Melioribacteraceae bacterium]|nr:tRNA epoxyqueuosine(34) reductase QueG [Melioribacteraceae bacterium]